MNTKLLIVGAGPGGYAAAFLAADLGLDVTLVDGAPNPGGVCLYRGCIPSKALLHIAKVINEAEEASAWGVEFAKPKLQLDKMRAWKESVVTKLTGGLGQLVKQRKVNYVRGMVKFVSATRAIVTAVGKDTSTTTIDFENAIIATGSQPTEIPIFNIANPRVVNSTGALNLPEIPERMLVVGGGYIGLELGSVYAALGSKVDVVEMTDGLLPGADRDLVRFLQKRVQQKFHAVHLNTAVQSLETAGKTQVKATFKTADDEILTEKYNLVLVSIGRKPHSAGLGLENIGIELDARGFIPVDKQLRTQVPNIFAIGDIAGEPMLAHKASHEGRVAVEVISGEKVEFAPNAIPAVVFTDPEIAWCGLTESQAKKEGIPIKVARFPWAASGRAMTLDRQDGLTKLIIDPETERILGVGITGPGAGELIAEGTLAVEMAANATDLKLTIHAHPTLSETMMEAAEVFFGQSTHVYRPRRS